MVHVQCTYIIQVHFDYCNIICLAMRPLQQNFTHYIKMTIEFDDKMQHLDNKQLGRVGGGIGQRVMAQGPIYYGLYRNVLLHREGRIFKQHHRNQRGLE